MKRIAFQLLVAASIVSILLGFCGARENTYTIHVEAATEPSSAILSFNRPAWLTDASVTEGNTFTSTTSVKIYIEFQAALYGVPIDVADFVSWHESHLDPTSVGDNGISLGIWQINLLAHPAVTRQCAQDVVCSTAWSMEEMALGRASEWSTFRFCAKWYGYCPEGEIAQREAF